MSKKLQNQLFLIASTLLAAFFVYVLFSKIDKEKTLFALQNANYLWLFISVILAIFSYYLRALRWNILFEPMGYNIKTRSGFWAISFAYFMNLVIPRSGEIARATSLYSMENVPVDKSLGTIVLERIIDLLFLVIFGILTLIFSRKPFEIFLEMSKNNENESSASNNGMYILLVVMAISVMLFIVFRKKIIQSHFYKKVLEWLRGFKEGLLSISKIKHKTAFILYSFGIWICYFLMTFLVIFSFEETNNIPWNYGFFLMIAGSFGMILPATGGLAYPLVMRYAFGAIFLAMGWPVEDGYDAGSYFGISLYLAQVLFVIIFGFLAMNYISRNNVRKKESKLKTT